MSVRNEPIHVERMKSAGTLTGHSSAPARRATTVLPATWSALIWTSVKTTPAMSTPRASTPSGPTPVPANEVFQAMAPNARIQMSVPMKARATHGRYAPTSSGTSSAPVRRALEGMASPARMWMSAPPQIAAVHRSRSASTPPGLTSAPV